MNETICPCHEPALRLTVPTALPSMRMPAEPRRGSFAATSAIARPVNVSETLFPYVLELVRVWRQEPPDPRRPHVPRRTSEPLRSSTACITTTGPVAQGLQLPAASTALTRKR